MLRRQQQQQSRDRRLGWATVGWSKGSGVKLVLMAVPLGARNDLVLPHVKSLLAGVSEVVSCDSNRSRNSPTVEPEICWNGKRVRGAADGVTEWHEPGPQAKHYQGRRIRSCQ